MRHTLGVISGFVGAGVIGYQPLISMSLFNR